MANQEYDKSLKDCPCKASRISSCLQVVKNNYINSTFPPTHISITNSVKWSFINILDYKGEKLKPVKEEATWLIRQVLSLQENSSKSPGEYWEVIGAKNYLIFALGIDGSVPVQTNVAYEMQVVFYGIKGKQKNFH